MARRWSREATNSLLDGVGAFGLEWFRRRGGASYDYPNAPVKRSRAAVYAKAHREFGEGGLTRGVRTLHELSAQTGYTRGQLRRAGHALNQKWKRLGPRGAHLISDEQAEEILTWLQHDFWSKSLHLYACLHCGTSNRPHRAAGLCGRCYYRYRRRCLDLGLPAGLREQVALILRLDKQPGVEAKLLDMSRRLEHGKALGLNELDWLIMLYPG